MWNCTLGGGIGCLVPGASCRAGWQVLGAVLSAACWVPGAPSKPRSLSQPRFRDQCILLLASPTFQLTFPSERFTDRIEGFGIDERHGAASRCVPSAATAVMHALTFPGIAGTAGVQRAVGTADDVDVMHPNSL